MLIRLMHLSALLVSVFVDEVTCFLSFVHFLRLTFTCLSVCLHATGTAHSLWHILLPRVRRASCILPPPLLRILHPLCHCMSRCVTRVWAFNCAREGHAKPCDGKFLYWLYERKTLPSFYLPPTPVVSGSLHAQLKYQSHNGVLLQVV